MMAALTVVFASIVFLYIVGRRGGTEVDSATKQLVATLREAQSRAMSQSQGTAWGVYIHNTTNTQPYFALVSSSTYSTSTRANYFSLPQNVSYASTSLASGASRIIVFSQISGAASPSSSITLVSLTRSNISSTISVASSGRVSF